jgi:hypothetical protein
MSLCPAILLVLMSNGKAYYVSKKKKILEKKYPLCQIVNCAPAGAIALFAWLKSHS